MSHRDLVPHVALQNDDDRCDGDPTDGVETFQGMRDRTGAAAVGRRWHWTARAKKLLPCIVTLIWCNEGINILKPDVLDEGIDPRGFNTCYESRQFRKVVVGGLALINPVHATMSTHAHPGGGSKGKCELVVRRYHKIRHTAFGRVRLHGTFFSHDSEGDTLVGQAAALAHSRPTCRSLSSSTLTVCNCDPIGQCSPNRFHNLTMYNPVAGTTFDCGYEGVPINMDWSATGKYNGTKSLQHCEGKMTTKKCNAANTIFGSHWFALLDFIGVSKNCPSGRFYKWNINGPASPGCPGGAACPSGAVDSHNSHIHYFSVCPWFF